jgi:hypothetical protein
MALRVARGLFRLWLVLSVLWVAAVGATSLMFGEPVSAYVRLESMLDTCINEKKGDGCAEWLRRGAPWLALIPPIVVLAIGWALIWAFRGFWQREDEV